VKRHHGDTKCVTEILGGETKIRKLGWGQNALQLTYKATWLSGKNVGL